MWSVVDRNVVMWRMSVLETRTAVYSSHHHVLQIYSMFDSLNFKNFATLNIPYTTMQVTMLQPFRY
jgi:hypothetical protein